MSPTRLIKHNPAFLSSAELVDRFVVRCKELELLLKIVRENKGDTNQHAIVIGPRGSGKTMLLLRLALAVSKDDELGRLWYPVIFPEEVYDIAKEGELWLQTLRRITDQEHDAGMGNTRWRERFEALRHISDDHSLRNQAIAALSEFAAEKKRRLLVIIENLQMILGESMRSDVQWDLRNTLSHNREIMLVTSATLRFAEIENANKANFDLFREITLRPLSTSESRVLWQSITEELPEDRRIRPMEILTGGSPRLLAILADFAKGRSLQELMEDLAVLVDENTTYFKANIESLPLQERRVFVTLMEIWEQAEARQVAERCRLEVNHTSALLNRLLEKGAIVQADKVGRKNLYQVAERLYNIYYLMRLAGQEADRVRALVRFMAPFYSEERIGKELASEACRHTGKTRLPWIEGYNELLAQAERNDEVFDYLRLLEETPKDFFSLPETVKIRQHFNEFLVKDRLFSEQFGLLLDKVGKKLKEGKLDSVLEIINDEMLPLLFERREKGIFHLIQILSMKAFILNSMGRPEDAISVNDEIITRYGERPEAALAEKVATALFNKGNALGRLGQAEQAIAAYDEIVSRYGERPEAALAEKVAAALGNKGVALGGLGHVEQAIAAYDEVVSRYGERPEAALAEKVATALFNKGVTLGGMRQVEKTIAVYDEMVSRYGERPEAAELVAKAMVNKGYALRGMGQAEQEIAAYDEVVSRYGERPEAALAEQVAKALVSKGIALRGLGQAEQAITAYNEVISRYGERSEEALKKQVASAFNGRAWEIFKGRSIEKLDEALKDVQTAIELKADCAYRHTWASLLGLACQWEEAFAQAHIFSDDEDCLKQFPSDIIDFYIDAAAAGQAEGALAAIKGTKLEKEMEPLVVALKMAAGQPYRAPLEVEEVARDVVKKIEEKAKKEGYQRPYK